MAEELAAQAALATVQQVPEEMTITATAESVEFIEPRGRSVFKTDGKNASVDVPGGSIRVKSRWDRGSLRQEFSSAQRTLKRSWSIDEQDHLVLTQHIESISLMTKDARAVFDRRQANGPVALTPRAARWVFPILAAGERQSTRQSSR